MAFNSEHLYVQWGGKLPGGETWSCGFRMGKKSGGAVDSGAGLLAPVSAALAQFHQSSQSKINANCKLSFVKVNAINTAGNYRDQGTNEATFPDVAGGTANSGLPMYPNQIALVVSLVTGFTRGLAHRGRFYLPAPVVAIGADTRITAGDRDTVSDAVDNLMAAVNASNADYEMRVFSARGAGGNRKITGNVVGRVLDTQRRRRTSVKEEWA